MTSSIMDMKKKMKLWAGAMMAMMVLTHAAAQKIDDERMKRDVEVGENVLATLVRQQVNENRAFFGFEVTGSYQEGYGVTFRLPGDYALPAYTKVVTGRANTAYIYRDDMAPAISIGGGRVDGQNGRLSETENGQNSKSDAMELRDKVEKKRREAADSARDEYNKRMIKAAKDFILDYGDLISQLPANERIVVTNQNENRSWYFKENKRTHISVEGLKSDVTAFRQGKLTRDQALGKLKVVNTEYVDVKEPDLELISSIFGRLYRSDLSDTYFSSESNIYYERLKDYGVIFHMQVFSSNEQDYRLWSMPTVGLEGLSQEARDKKVVEMYPKFEQGLKENIVEYGRTIKSLGDEEVMVFNVAMTKCAGCGIPSSLELSVKGSVLKDFSAGKIDKNAATGKIIVKKGAKQ